MTVGIRVSIENKDVTKAVNKDKSLDSEFEILKIFKSGRIELTSTWNTVYHGLGYTPQYLVYTTDEATDPNRVYLATADVQTAVARADGENLYIRQEGTGSTAVYYIFYEKTERY